MTDSESRRDPEPKVERESESEEPSAFERFFCGCFVVLTAFVLVYGWVKLAQTGCWNIHPMKKSQNLKVCGAWGIPYALAITALFGWVASRFLVVVRRPKSDASADSARPGED